jgi:hypothetical protein
MMNETMKSTRKTPLLGARVKHQSLSVLFTETVTKERTGKYFVDTITPTPLRSSISNLTCLKTQQVTTRTARNMTNEPSSIHE